MVSIVNRELAVHMQKIELRSVSLLLCAAEVKMDKEINVKTETFDQLPDKIAKLLKQGAGKGS